MKKILKYSWLVYSTLGAIWLTFTIFSFTVMNRRTTSTIQGRVENLIETEWNGYNDVRAVIETADGHGSVVVKLYEPGIDVGDSVNVKISQNDRGTGYIHSSLVRK